jgi:Subtilase family
MTGTRILVKANPALAGAALTIAQRPFRAEKVFEHIEPERAQGVAAPATWHLLSSPVDDANAWDACHALQADGLGVAGGGVAFAEPDLQQRWLSGDERMTRIALTAGCAAADPEDERYPTNSDKFWLRRTGFSQFDAAAAALGAQAGQGVRIAHLDTGYDPAHRSLPANMRHDLERNFVDAARPRDATDTTGSGALNNPGHGTGTLGLLAGRAFDSVAALGGAPAAEIVPIRVADSVILFYNSAIAKALDYVYGLAGDPRTAVQVVTMSMGGLASQAWADAVNSLYERGVFIVTAAGNNYGNLPTRNIVYPARFGRVVAACGVMADHTPYADLPLTLMAGNYGPDSKMTTALAAYTPNTTWARRGCPSIIDFDGNGTSSATPQVAAAAALWIQKYAARLAGYNEDWMRAEAVRQALFQSAKASADSKRLGRGELKANDALAKAPLAALRKAPVDSARFPFLDTLTGHEFGALPDMRRRMLELEALQLSQSADVEAALPDPTIDPNILSHPQRQRIVEALMAQPGLSRALRDVLDGQRPTTVAIGPVPGPQLGAVAQAQLRQAMAPAIPLPPRRKLRVLAFDPSLAVDLETVAINEAVIEVRWEADLRPGPVGEYVEVVDVDPGSDAAYAPVDLNHPSLLPQNGLAPTEGDPRFHQQMAYAVAMRTIEHFERALGRTALWAPRPPQLNLAAPAGAAPAPRDRRKGGDTAWDPYEGYVQRLRIYPHALRAANAFYSPDRKALLLGYFTASRDSAGSGLPHGVYFASLSHDVIAHETTHALLDGLHRRFREPTNPDVLAFHEAFADIVALFQHFTMPESLLHQIRRTRGDLSQESLLSQLAVEFGQAMRGDHGALRDFIGGIDPATGEWRVRKPTPNDYSASDEPHARGAVLVSAVFAAYLAIYKARTADLVRLATNGSGILPAGEISADLSKRMADEAAKVATQVLGMCIRALDYCPPVDITFGDYLRALITADRDLVPDDPRGYRTAFAAAFRDRGIFPRGTKHLSPGNLIWNPPLLEFGLKRILDEMDLSWNLYGNRREAYATSRKNAVKLHAWLTDPRNVSGEELASLALSLAGGPILLPDPYGASDATIQGVLHALEVHSVRPARRIGPDGQSQTDLVIEITQRASPASGVGANYRGGCTLIVDLGTKGGSQTNKVRYAITKRLSSADRLREQAAFRLGLEGNHRVQYFAQPPGGDEPFALLHGVI